METDTSIKPADLRGILKYVPLFRGQTFVVAIDGSIILHENFRNLLMDLAVLRSLNIRIVVVHGVGQQIRTLAQECGTAIGDAYGTGPTDETTLRLAIEATGQVGYEMIARFTELGISCASTNAIRATEVGVIRGEDFQHTGKVEKVDGPFLEKLLTDGVLPLMSPLAPSRTGRLLRVNSDWIAAEIAVALRASKLIFLTFHPGLHIGGEPLLNSPAEDLAAILKERPGDIPELLLSKVKASLYALGKETPRAHILDGRIFGAILTEVFDKVGLGTMIHSNEYQKIRRAAPEDLHSLHNLILNAASSDAVRARTKENLAAEIDHFYVYEIDGSLVACAALYSDAEAFSVELAAVYVQPFYQGRGVGLKMVRYAEKEARRLGAKQLFALSTQSFPFFKEVCGFSEGTVADLPDVRRALYEKESRRSKIIIKPLDHAPD